MSQDTHAFLDMYENITPDTCTISNLSNNIILF